MLGRESILIIPDAVPMLMPSERAKTERSRLGVSSLSFCVSTSSRVMEGKRQGLTVTTKLLIEFLARRAPGLLAVDHPFLVDSDTTPIFEAYERGALMEQGRFPVPRAFRVSRTFSAGLLPYYLLKVMDFVSTVYLVLRSRRKYDIFVGVEALNALAGLVLRKLGRVRFVLYYAIDYSRNRFPSILANSFFLRLDKYCATHSDILWNAFAGTQHMRAKVWSGEVGRMQILVPGMNPPPNPSDFAPRFNHRLVYLGSLGEQWGLQVVISGMKEILRRVPDAELHVIGHGPFRAQLEKQSRDLGVEKNVFFHGFLLDQQASAVIRQSRVGVAPYLDQGDSLRSPELDSSKVKYYATFGVPVVLSTAVPSLTDLVNRFQAGNTAPPEEKPFVESICRLLLDNELYVKSVSGAFRLANQFDADREYEALFKKSFEALFERGT